MGQNLKGQSMENAQYRIERERVRVFLHFVRRQLDDCFFFMRKKKQSSNCFRTKLDDCSITIMGAQWSCLS